MKKIILVLLFLGTINTVQAAVYPDKLNNNKPFNKYENFRGIYDKIYQDVHNEDLVKVCERTLMWPEFWKEGELIYSLDNCKNFEKRGEFSESFLNMETPNIKDFNNFRENFEGRFNQEQEALRIENDLKRKTGLAGIFTDGTEDQKSSRFDLISSLNELDKTFFGEKAEKPEFEYTKNRLELNDEENDNWLTQTEENLPTKEENFAETKNVISGALWESGTKVLRENLNTYPLWAGHVGKHMGDAVEMNGVLGDSNFTAGTHSFPSLSTTKPEASVLKYSPLSKLKAFNAQFQFGQSAFLTEAETDVRTRSQLDIVLNEKKRQEEEIKNNLIQFKEGQLRNYEDASFTTMLPVLEKFKLYVDFFREKSKLINTEIFPSFFEKPIYSS